MVSLVKHFLKSPSIYYARRTMAICRDRLLGTHPPEYQVDKAPFINNYRKYEPLFRNSEQRFEAIIAPYISEFRWSLGRIYNGAFVSIDPELYYSIIRKYQPNLIIEVGSGHSTHFAMDAIKRNQTGYIISIDPEPQRSLPAGVEHKQMKIENVDLDIFKTLCKNDILFIDSSHTTEETKYHCERILPSLNTGVIVHHHDFTFPFRIYYCNDPTIYSEPDVLLKFYTDNTEAFEVIVCASYVRYKNFGLVNRLIKSYTWNSRRIPGSLWTRKST